MSTDLERLRTKFASGALTHPRGSVPSVVDLAAAFWVAAGADVSPSDAASAMRERIGTPRHLVLVIADGLGLDLLESMPAASFLWQHVAGEARTVFPSTTAAVLTSLHTARWPGEHGVIGHWLLGPRDVGSINVLPYTRRGDQSDLDAIGVQVDEVFQSPALLGRGERDALFVLPERIVRGRFSEFSAGAGERIGYRSLGDGVDAVLTHIRGAVRDTCTVLYLSRIDDAAHEHGPTHLEVVGEVRALDAEMQRLASELGGEDARIVLTADHGHLPVPQGASRVLRGDDDIGRYLRTAPTGDARVAYFHLERVDEVEAFSSAFRERWGEQFVLLTPDEVIAEGLLGEVVTSTARARLGDAVAISLGPDVLEFRPVGGKADPRLTLRSQHSGLTAAEMRVPFVVI
ncbi:MAG: hypothetical protein DWI48_06780 [Chloroflexi bacterium]|nr:MAG: hypothetical protein DWI48_06780 [Chloroflexota bacterium]